MAVTGTQERAMDFTKEQIANWEAYEEVRKGGRYNMYDPNARSLTGLTREEYSFVMKHFSELKEAAAEGDKRC